MSLSAPAPLCSLCDTPLRALYSAPSPLPASGRRLLEERANTGAGGGRGAEEAAAFGGRPQAQGAAKGRPGGAPQGGSEAASYRNLAEAEVALQAVHALLAAGDVTSAAVRRPSRPRQPTHCSASPWLSTSAVVTARVPHECPGVSTEYTCRPRPLTLSSPIHPPLWQILSPYKGQVRALEALLRSRSAAFKGRDVVVSSVDGYQVKRGGEGREGKTRGRP